MTSYCMSPSLYTPLPLDGKHVVFGEVVSGYDLVKKIETYGSQNGKTSKKITISACGQL